MQRPVIAITQARIGSTRLPGKVLRDICGKPLLWWHLTRLQRCRLLDGIVVATTEEPGADAIVEIATDLGVAVWRGPVDDVLGRYLGAARAAKAATIVRVTSDCPVIDPALVDSLIQSYDDAGGSLDYMSLDGSRLPRGLDAEIFSSDMLEIAAREARDAAEREHVTAFMYRRPDRFRIGAVAPASLGQAGLRLCVDTPVDFELVRRVIETLLPDDPCFAWADIARVFALHPEWALINANIVQNS